MWTNKTVTMIAENIKSFQEKIPEGVRLVAVSKFHPAEDIREAYKAGQRDFGENRPQEFASKVEELRDLEGIRWHFIGHLQTNKLKMVLPYADIVESIDTVHLLDEVAKWAKTNGRIVNILLEMHIGAEETKQGFYEEEILSILFNASSGGKYAGIRFCGLMGMASHTDDADIVRADFERIRSFMDYLQDLFPELEDFKELSIGMSEDWQIAVDCGSTEVRIGTAIFGERK